MVLLDPDLRRTWLFGPSADPAAHARMLDSGADALIVDLEDFTPPARRPEARGLLDRFVRECRQRQRVAAVRINALETDGLLDLAAAMTARPDVIAYPMSDSAAQMHALDAAISHWERQLDLDQGSTEILPVCETALGVVEVRTMAAATSRIRCALLGAEDLANDLCAERGADGLELDYARRRFILEARAAGIEPIDAPYTFSDVEGAIREAVLSRRLGYRSKSLVLPEHALRLNDVFTPGADEIARAHAIVAGFDAARSRGEDRALVDGLWVEVPTYRNARRLMERARRLGTLPSET
ncbi:HpcH/HpaI aldolase/citrate lyase family protein [Bradyrhizobium guangxiense]|uniref:HpcH/HpaI aldolase/citrate lyase family protein n=1 Tax=Bradyrhizobium guangxiense TaxID=1325115 RepID=UPI0013E8D155|nr:CoA ester lyase [Bradyrhizobium guangxiense]